MMKTAKFAAILSVLVVLGSLPAYAGPDIDGRFDPSEGYTTGYYANFLVENKDGPLIPVAEQGQLWTHQDSSGNLSMAFIQPKSLVDNSYGSTSVGWGSFAPSGKNHNFKDLTGSDKAQFVFTDSSGGTLLDITLDYLHGTGLKPDGKNDKNLPPYFGGLVDDGGNLLPDVMLGDTKAKDLSAAQIAFAKAAVIDSATSLEYNWNQFGGTHGGNFGENSDSPATGSQDPSDPSSYVVGSGGPSGWLFDVIYEFKIAGSALAGYSGFHIEVVHDSPNKIGDNKVYDDFTPVPVPAPGAVLLGMLGLSVAGVKLRKSA